MANILMPSRPSPPGSTLPLVVIAASAGGLDPISEILGDYPGDLDVATVVIQHLSPAYRSELVGLLQSHSEQPVHELHDGTQLLPRNIYVIQPGTQIMLQADNTIRAITRDESGRPYFTIDVFLESATRRDEPIAACVVLLSGTGSDGTAGCRAIHDHGGFVLVQQLSDAKFDGMPLSVINSGSYDEVQPPRLICARITAWLENGLRKPAVPQENLESDPLALLYADSQATPGSDINPYAGIFELMRSSFDLDLNAYKIGTIDRRITQRMRRLGVTTIDQYYKLLAQGGHELRTLFTDLMIGVTSFFRNPQVFELLESKILPDLLERNSEPLKIWVCGCSSGEEAYSVAMLLQKLVNRMDRDVEFRIYATDLNPDSIRRAAEGTYQYSTLHPFINRFELQEFVTPSEDFGRLRVSGTVRRKIIFSVQNVLKHSPLHALDLVFCRNMLIYLRPEAQRKVISNFHFGLKESGILVLGESEGPAGLEPYFSEIDARLKIFGKRAGVKLSASDRWQLNRSIAMIPPSRHTAVPRDTSHLTIPRGAFEAAFSSVAGNSLIIRADGEVQYVTGHAGEIFARAVPGRPSLNLHTHVQADDVQALLQLGLSEALESQSPIQWDYPYQLEGSQLHFDQLRFTRLPTAFEREPWVLVQMLASDRQVHYLQDTPHHARDVLTALQSGSGGLGRLARLEQENAQLRQLVTESVQDKETFHEELQSANEELLSSNEELQSTNEELQSVNEELHSVNAELEEKIRQLTEANSDITNLLTSTDVALIFLDDALRIRRYTEAARNYFPLGLQDVGRPIADLASSLAGLDIPALGRHVLTSGAVQRRDVHLGQKQWLQVVLSPYYNHEGQVQGVVVTVYDISHTRQLLQVEQQARLQRELVQEVLTIGYLEIPDLSRPELLLDDHVKQYLGLAMDSRSSQDSFSEHLHPADVTGFNQALDEVSGNGQRQTRELRMRDSSGHYHWMLCSIVLNPGAEKTGLLAMLLDIDQRKRDEIDSHEKEITAIHANRIFNIGMLVSGVAHELNNPLSALRLGNEQLQRQASSNAPQTPLIARIADMQADAVTRMDRIISSLLRFARKDDDTSMKMVHVDTLVQDTLQLTRAMASELGVEMLHDPIPAQLTLLGHPLELAQALVNLVSNAIQHVATTEHPRWVRVQVDNSGDECVLRVVDSGLTSNIAHPERLFTPFYTTKDVGQGTGLGLILSQGIAEAHAGSLALDKQARNTTFVMRIPSRPIGVE